MASSRLATAEKGNHDDDEECNVVRLSALLPLKFNKQ